MFGLPRLAEVLSCLCQTLKRSAENEAEATGKKPKLEAPTPKPKAKAEPKADPKAKADAKPKATPKPKAAADLSDKLKNMLAKASAAAPPASSN